MRVTANQMIASVINNRAVLAYDADWIPIAIDDPRRPFINKRCFQRLSRSHTAIGRAFTRRGDSKVYGSWL